uniref:Uncharacterized protein n=1 Tax=Phenylobacterium glaciei TaxID=2803784 RepID=A0A974P3Q3_9CAUL|nr:hypothetical protein JKL49_01485 [Phenylobacterium glaciei]
MAAAYPRKEMMVRVCEAVEKGARLHQLEQRPGFPAGRRSIAGRRRTRPSPIG